MLNNFLNKKRGLGKASVRSFSSLEVGENISSVKSLVVFYYAAQALQTPYHGSHFCTIICEPCIVGWQVSPAAEHGSPSLHHSHPAASSDSSESSSQRKSYHSRQS